VEEQDESRNSWVTRHPNAFTCFKFLLEFSFIYVYIIVPFR